VITFEDEGGGLLVGVHRESATTAAVDPSLTVVWQVVDVKPEARTLNRPDVSALPVAVDSEDDTMIVALAFAPPPSTTRSPELSSALLTLTAASAVDTGIKRTPTISTDTSAAARRPAENVLLERFMSLLPHFRAGASGRGAARPS
jgi:hypothetical protein